MPQQLRTLRLILVFLALSHAGDENPEDAAEQQPAAEDALREQEEKREEMEDEPRAAAETGDKLPQTRSICAKSDSLRNSPNYRPRSGYS